MASYYPCDMVHPAYSIVSAQGPNAAKLTPLQKNRIRIRIDDDLNTGFSGELVRTVDIFTLAISEPIRPPAQVASLFFDRFKETRSAQVHAGVRPAGHHGLFPKSPREPRIFLIRPMADDEFAATSAQLSLL